ncbi:MAG TPA: hypothetical protein VFN10_05545 [Thermoanaerobaculia bacterium]|nr:hypothetical protein [Thermoanaerobaculia bacterium]
MHAILALALFAAIDVTSAQNAIKELDAMCAADSGRLWGRELCGPVLLVDRETRQAVTKDGVVTLPESVGIANTAVDWNGQRYTMVMLPLPKDDYARHALLAHESFHRVQEQLGFKATGPSNAHLDSLDGRYWLRLEWRALAKALQTGDARAVSDALAFRAQRRALFSTAAEEERQLEMHEGLAEYTGTAFAARPLKERLPHLTEQLANAEKNAKFMRSFAYASGPAWGALIEMKDPNWTRTLKPGDDLGDVARRAWKLDDTYGAAALRAEEEARDTKRRERQAALRKEFVEGPVLTLPLAQMEMQFDPNGLEPLEGVGTVYSNITISDAWGKLEAPEGALITSDFKKLIVPLGRKYTLDKK